MAAKAAKNAVFKVDDSGGTLRDLSAFLNNIDFNRERNALETSVYGLGERRYIAGKHRGTFSVTGLFDDTATTGPHAVLSKLPGAAATSTFEYGPEGGASGKPRITGECVCTAYRISAGADAVVSFSAEFTITAAVTHNTF
jgi:hypothetical protein